MRTTESPHSAALVERLVQSAVEKCQAIDRGRAVERRPVRRYAGIIAAIAVVTLAVFSLGPAYLRHALSALLIISRSVEAAAPYRIEVTPGNATVPKGIDQTVKAKLEGFDSEQAALMVRKSPDAIRADVARSFGDRGCPSLRGHARPGRADRLLRRSGRGAVAHACWTA